MNIKRLFILLHLIILPPLLSAESFEAVPVSVPDLSSPQYFTDQWIDWQPLAQDSKLQEKNLFSGVLTSLRHKSDGTSTTVLTRYQTDHNGPLTETDLYHFSGSYEVTRSKSVDFAGQRLILSAQADPAPVWNLNIYQNPAPDESLPVIYQSPADGAVLQIPSEHFSSPDLWDAAVINDELWILLLAERDLILFRIAYGISGDLALLSVATIYSSPEERIRVPGIAELNGKPVFYWLETLKGDESHLKFAEMSSGRLEQTASIRHGFITRHAYEPYMFQADFAPFRYRSTITDSGMDSGELLLSGEIIKVQTVLGLVQSSFFTAAYHPGTRNIEMNVYDYFSPAELPLGNSLTLIDETWFGVWQNDNPMRGTSRICGSPLQPAEEEDSKQEQIETRSYTILSDTPRYHRTPGVTTDSSGILHYIWLEGDPDGRGEYVCTRSTRAPLTAWHKLFYVHGNKTETITAFILTIGLAVIQGLIHSTVLHGPLLILFFILINLIYKYKSRLIQGRSAPVYLFFCLIFTGCYGLFPFSLSPLPTNVLTLIMSAVGAGAFTLFTTPKKQNPTPLELFSRVWLFAFLLSLANLLPGLFTGLNTWQG